MHLGRPFLVGLLLYLTVLNLHFRQLLCCQFPQHTPILPEPTPLSQMQDWGVRGPLHISSSHLFRTGTQQFLACFICLSQLDASPLTVEVASSSWVLSQRKHSQSTGTAGVLGPGVFVHYISSKEYSKDVMTLVQTLRAWKM